MQIKIRKCTKKSEYAKSVLGNDQYPKSITDANNILSNHKIKAHDKQQHIRSANKKDEANNATDITSEDIPLSFTQIEGRCYCCGRYGRKSSNCRKKDQIIRED